jgi:beta-lactamase superfamily II metal-dependent hydrolase
MEFIEACSPDAAVISVGAHNFYGHPAPATLDRLNSYGCKVFRTDEEGAVVMEF